MNTIIVLLISIVLGARAALAKRPVVLVPGIGGSILEARLNLSKSDHPPHWICSRWTRDYRRIWIRLREIVPIQADCMMWYMQHEWNGAAGRLEPRAGVDIRTPPEWGSVRAVDSLDPGWALSAYSQYFHRLIDELEGEAGQGYRDGEDLVAAAYDWRRFPYPEWAAATKALVERAFARSGGQGVVLVSHSMGCPITYRFLMAQTAAWRRKFVHWWVPVAPVWTGTPLAFVAMLSGYTMGVPLSRTHAVALTRTLPAVYYLLPNSDLGWGGDKGDKGDVLLELPWMGPGEGVRVGGMGDFLEENFDMPYANAVIRQAREFYRECENYARRPEFGITVIYGNEVQTVNGMRAIERNENENGNETDNEIKNENKNKNGKLIYQYLNDTAFNSVAATRVIKGDLIYTQDGDGTVVGRSLRYVCELWGLGPESCVELKGVNHVGALSDDLFIATIKRLIN